MQAGAWTPLGKKRQVGKGEPRSRLSRGELRSGISIDCHPPFAVGRGTVVSEAAVVVSNNGFGEGI